MRLVDPQTQNELAGRPRRDGSAGGQRGARYLKN